MSTTERPSIVRVLTGGYDTIEEWSGQLPTTDQEPTYQTKDKSLSPYDGAVEYLARTGNKLSLTALNVGWQVPGGERIPAVDVARLAAEQRMGDQDG
jgi:hypothetical protein